MREDTTTTLDVLESSERKGLSYTRIGPPQEVVGDASPLAVVLINDEVALAQNEHKDPPPETI
jgi:hypothetical protein